VLSYPTCRTDFYTFESDSLRDYVVCAMFEAAYYIISYHVYRKGLGVCPTCRIRDEYWAALWSLM
jgi:hypothetical protein